MLELQEYRKYTKPAELNKSINLLIGLLQGLQADRVINAKEIEELENWCLLHEDLSDRHPFSEIIPLIRKSLNNNVFTKDACQDLLWVCQNVAEDNSYYDYITVSIQVLHGILHGLLADGVLNDKEIDTLAKWMQEHQELSGTYPYDEINSLLTAALADHKISEDERNMLMAFFSNFVDTSMSQHVHETSMQQLREQYTIEGVCASCPEISIDGKQFCFTGTSLHHTREQIAEVVVAHGGIFHNDVSSKTNYLVVGNAGNPCWAFACYGRKVEKAMAFRKKGNKILIINENDFWDALQDLDA